ncbi:MAG: DUF3344 domain-containing protein [Labilithrix sp.]|nr:DUF3344 domain-containing protein [Labilithrix sp.]
MKSPSLALLVASTLTLGLISVDAHADGSGTFGKTLVKRGKGVNAAAFGVGLSGRLAGAASSPVAAATIAVSDLPAGAVIQNAYLYWVTYGTAGHPTITLDGTAVTGTAIGSSQGTCWTEYPSFLNFTYRADVTATFTGNGSHTLTDFPSGAADADTQGATLFVVYTDPAATTGGHVLLYDGAMTSRSTSSVSGTFADVQPPAVISSVRFMVGVGDGESVLPDGALRVREKPLSFPPPGGQHFRGSAGNYWDDRSYDVSEHVDASHTSVGWRATFSQDCLVFAYAALTIQSPTVPTETTDPDAGDGSSSGSSGSTGSSGASGSSNGGADADGGSDDAAGGAAPDAVSGCGCRFTEAETRYAPAAIVVAGLALARLRRRR